MKNTASPEVLHLFSLLRLCTVHVLFDACWLVLYFFEGGKQRLTYYICIYILFQNISSHPFC